MTASATPPLCIAVVGHVNVGKTSLLRTLTRQADFGQVADRPGVTRHAEAVALRLDGHTAVRYIDTPGLEDPVALQALLAAQPGESRPAKVRAFLSSPEAHTRFEQEAKVLRAVLEQADAAMLVIDTRQPVLPKYRAEIDLLTWCSRPVMPVLNFVRADNTRQSEWQHTLQEHHLHARASFDAVAPFNGAEQQLYTDLATLLPARRAQLADIAQALARAADARRQVATRVVTSALIDVAAMRRQLPAEDAADPARRQRFVQQFQDDVRAHATQARQAVLDVFGFRPQDAALDPLPQLDQRWTHDLFNPELLKQAGKTLGLGAAIGMGLGAVADLALAGLSFGAATTLGATLGGAASGGWRPLWRKLGNRLSGTQELTADDALLLLMAAQLLQLVQALADRSHARQDRLQLGLDTRAADHWRPLLRNLARARAHPAWETPRLPTPWQAPDAERERLCEVLAQQLHALL